MEKTRSKLTTIAVSKETFLELLKIKHNLESKNSKSYSHNKVIKTLINSYGILQEKQL